jgi:saccharopine dehydrogenase (NAD+, L-glutamate forming)
MAERPWDLVLFGATGFTGQLVAEHLLRRAPADVRWAIAGRDTWKLRDVGMGLVGLDRVAGARVGRIEADAHDPESLRALARQARVVVSTVGPYAIHGRDLLAACVAEGTHYLDITGEPDFVAHSRRTHGVTAAERGLKIVHCCGFDSVPADLGTLFTVRLLPPGVPKTVKAYLRTRGRPSGGTWASLVEGLARGAPDRATTDPTPTDREPRTRTDRLKPRLHRGRDVGWAVPLPVIDPVVVKSTARLRPDDYGPEFQYGHYLRVSRLRKLLRLGGGIAGIWALAQWAPTRRWLEARIPSGSGPDASERKRSFFELTFVGQAGAARVTTRVAGGDPGYDETSRMLGECALLLVAGSDLPDSVGVLSPGAAFGPALIERLVEVGLSFERVD